MLLKGVSAAANTNPLRDSASTNGGTAGASASTSWIRRGKPLISMVQTAASDCTFRAGVSQRHSLQQPGGRK